MWERLFSVLCVLHLYQPDPCCTCYSDLQTQSNSCRANNCLFVIFVIVYTVILDITREMIIICSLLAFMLKQNLVLCFQCMLELDFAGIPYSQKIINGFIVSIHQTKAFMINVAKSGLILSSGTENVFFSNFKVPHLSKTAHKHQ